MYCIDLFVKHEIMTVLVSITEFHKRYPSFPTHSCYTRNAELIRIPRYRLLKTQDSYDSLCAISSNLNLVNLFCFQNLLFYFENNNFYYISEFLNYVSIQFRVDGIYIIHGSSHSRSKNIRFLGFIF